jgi:hypothetical protein
MIKLTLRTYIYIVSVFILQACSLSKETLIPSANEPVELPFEYLSELIIIEAEVEGIKGKFLFDNGFTSSAISPEFAARIEVDFRSGTSVNDANNKSTSLPTGKIKETNIGGQLFKNTTYYIIDTKLFFPCDDIDGVIGASIINMINWDIDFQYMKMKLQSTPFDPEGQTIDFDVKSGNSSFIEFKVNNVDVTAKS